MNRSSTWSSPRVIVAGGGVAALEAVLTLTEVADRRLEIRLLSPKPWFEYRALAVAEPFGLGLAHRFDLTELLQGRGIRVVRDALGQVDPHLRQLQTAAGNTWEYDALLVAAGARRRSGLPGALTFDQRDGVAELRRLLAAAVGGGLQSIVFAVPPGVGWALPAYELALMTGAHLEEHNAPTRVTVVSPEARPAAAFGDRASESVAEMLRMRGVSFRSAVPLRAARGRLLLEDGRTIPADAVVTLPAVSAPAIPGLPKDGQGFVPVDEHGRVCGVARLYAAGDITDFPLKQGGIATQQADAAAEAIAADLGCDLEPTPFRPVLRGLLLTGRAPRYLRAEALAGGATGSISDEEAIWWPPAKIAGRRLAPFLAAHGIGPAAAGVLAIGLSSEEG